MLGVETAVRKEAARQAAVSQVRREGGAGAMAGRRTCVVQNVGSGSGVCACGGVKSEHVCVCVQIVRQQGRRGGRVVQVEW